MSGVVDTVNFNSDASCLSAAVWLAALEGGERSTLSRWLRLYEQARCPVVLGFPGATVADIATFNPEAIELINAHPDVFEVVLRPFAHDISLLRTEQGFALNVEAGFRTIRREFDNVSDYYLPPEFMCNSAQVRHLAERGVKGLFIYPERFGAQIAPRIPPRPYRLRGILGSSLTAIPVDDALSQAYLGGIHDYSATDWNRRLDREDGDLAYSWRDGESALLLPDGVDREAAWLAAAAPHVERHHLGRLGDLEVEHDPRCIYSYPIHSFSAWIREMKMYWFIRQLQNLEDDLPSMDPFRRRVWLQAINSDILSAVEKRYPVIKLRNGAADGPVLDYTIYRQPKEFEGEEYLRILLDRGEDTRRYYETSDAPHMKRLRGRVGYLERLAGS